MTKKDDSLALLPNGFADLLPPEAENEAYAIQTLMDVFAGYGYQRIKPPLLEFEDSLLAPGPGELLAPETFRLMDPVSHRMLGVRSDITAQISRIVFSRLKKAPRPLRLMYANDVLRTRGSQIRAERQFAQVGCELIGDVEGMDADIEICVLALLGLKALGIGDITIDFTIPGFVPHLLEDVDDLDMIEVIAKAVAQRDRDCLQNLDHKVAQLIGQTMDVSGDAQEALSQLEGIKFEKILKEIIGRMKVVCEGVEAALTDLGVEDVSLSLDVLEQSGFEYHKSLGFTLFSSSIRGELGRGGSYDVHFGQNDEDEMGRGFTLYMDSILRAVDAPEPEKCVFVPYAEDWSVVRDLQKDGWVTVRGLEAPESCTHKYENGKVKERKKG